jgi:hypothetical protein
MGDKIFHITDEPNEHNLDSSDRTVFLCAQMALMTGKVKGFKAKAQELNPEIRFVQCLIHSDAIVAKALPTVLKTVLHEVIKIVYSVKLRPLSSQLYSVCARKWGLNTPFFCFTQKYGGSLVGRYYLVFFSSSC